MNALPSIAVYASYSIVYANTPFALLCYCRDSFYISISRLYATKLYLILPSSHFTYPHKLRSVMKCQIINIFFQLLFGEVG